MPEFEIIGIIKSKPLPLTRKTAKDLKKHLKNIGWRFGWLLFWQQTIQFLGYVINILLPGDGDRILPVWKISREYGIPVKHVHDINHPTVINLIQDLKPDIIVSAYFNQIIKEPVIDLPKFGILNIHPGWLPAYRGAMAYFWVLKNGSEKAGVSIHWIDKGIDTGELVSRREFKIKNGMTQQKVLIFTAVIGSILLQRIAKLLLTGQKLHAISVKGEPEQYYSLPGEKEFDDYFKHRRFFRIRDLVSFLLRRKNET